MQRRKKKKKHNGYNILTSHGLKNKQRESRSQFCFFPLLCRQCVTYYRAMLPWCMHIHTHTHSAEVIFCFSVLNPPPVSLSLGSVVSITLVLAIPPRLLCYHPSISVSHSISLPSSLCLFSLMYPLLTSPTAPSLLLLLLPDVSANFINRNKRLRHQWFANGCVLFFPPSSLT